MHSIRVQNPTPIDILLVDARKNHRYRLHTDLPRGGYSAHPFAMVTVLG